NRTPSTWLGRVERAVAVLDGREPEAESDPRQRIADARRSVRDAGGAASDRRHPARSLDGADAALYEALVEWRGKGAKAAGAPAYAVFHDATLVAVAEARPRDRRQLLAVAGVGPVKVERYGDDVLALVAAHRG